MATYIVRRVLWAIVLIILVSALTFLFFDILPAGDPAVLRAGHNAGPAAIQHIRVELGLDKPIYTQFFNSSRAIAAAFTSSQEPGAMSGSPSVLSIGSPRCCCPGSCWPPPRRRSTPECCAAA